LRAYLAIVLVLLLGACASASPFDHVPKGDPAYAECAFLAARGIIDARPAQDFGGEALLTRYDFTMSLAPLMAALETLASGEHAGAALDATARMTDSERAQVGETLTRLLTEFGDVLALLGRDASQAILGARLLAGPAPSSSSSPPKAEGGAGISYADARTRVGLLYRAGEGAAAALPQVPLGGLTDAPIAGLALTRLPAGSAPVDAAPPDRIASGDISLRRLQGTLEYGVTDSLTVNLAYESLVREGRGPALLDAASLRTLGVGYRFSPSTSVKLSYHLIDYADYTRAGARVADRMAEGELTVRF
jgi:hypothetical protein